MGGGGNASQTGNSSQNLGNTQQTNAVRGNRVVIDGRLVGGNAQSENSVVINDGRANTITINDGEEHSIEINDDHIIVNDQRIQNDANANDHHQHEDGANSIVIKEGRTNSVVINNAEQWNLGDLRRRSNIVVTSEHVTINGRHLPPEAWTNGEQSAQNVPRATRHSDQQHGCGIQ
uniref:Uncharacterized protein n=1 Tax=Globodera rostochiensis TaxID=31243 RepID=A0A914HKY4_GLORO